MHSAMLFILKSDTQRTDGMRQWQLAASWGTAFCFLSVRASGCNLPQSKV
ncbi:MAG TPA: hypothetical protein VGQ19_07325 [Burkholderiales bacterium]|jgi:hypothetical protein|nr:hypothetical protein [Burkholderiales bacterium]